MDIWRLRLEGDRVAHPWLAIPSLEASPSFSPDGRFVAYYSNESGRREVHVRPYPGPGPRHQVLAQGGNMPRFELRPIELVLVPNWVEELKALMASTH